MGLDIFLNLFKCLLRSLKNNQKVCIDFSIEMESLHSFEGHLCYHGLCKDSEKSMQNTLFKLQHYWASQGCLIMQPYDVEVGAGTSHPATFLKSLGKEDWACAYVQPSRRPTDGRYGKNPNRTQMYYQFQVIIKPAPVNAQELYLKSVLK